MNKKGICNDSQIGSHIVALLIFLTIVFIMVFFITSTIRYYELRSTIQDCDKEFGAGNWTFTETKDAYICNSYSKQTFITSSKECYENGIKINCSELE